MRKRIKILYASNELLWYSQNIGSEYQVARETDTAYWVIINDKHPIDWVLKVDCEVV